MSETYTEDDGPQKKKAKEILKSKLDKIQPGENDLSRKLAAFWKDQINLVDDGNKKYIHRGNMIIKRFRDQRNRVDEEGQRRMALLWANVKILSPALYGKPPIPIVDRAFLDKDPKGRLSSTMLERSIKNQIKHNGFHANVRRAVLDYLLPGRGINWVRYEPKFEQGVSLAVSEASSMEDALGDIFEDEGKGKQEEDTEEQDKLETTGERLARETVPVDYIDWKDIYLFPPTARTWEEVQAVGKRVMLSKEECIDRFGEEIGDAIEEDKSPTGADKKRMDFSDTQIFHDINERNREIFEIWNKTDTRVYWVSSGYDYLCDVKNDPLQLEKFFPVPEPISSTLTNDSLEPVADFLEYQDQAIQIDELTQRIAMLAKACKVAGTYDGGNGALKRLLNESVENQLIPVDNWAMYAEKGGVQGSISFLPLKEIQECINTLMTVRQQAMQDLDLITGVSDILRGTTDSRETLGGIRLKNNNAGTRLSERQDEIARYCCDIIRLIAEIISKHFSDESIIDGSGILFEEELQPDAIIAEQESQAPPQPAQPSPQPMQPQPQPPGPPQPGQPGQPPQPQLPPPPQQPMLPPPQPEPPQVIILKRVQDAIKLLRNDVLRDYRIDIETDSTIYGDAMQERQDATEFLQAVNTFLQAAEALSAQGSIPEIIPLLGRMLQFGVRKFRTGRDLEASIDTFVRNAEKRMKQQLANPKPNPEEVKQQMELQKMQIDLQNGREERQNRLQEREAEAEIQRRNDIRDFQKQQAEDQREMMIMRIEAENKQAETAANLKKIAMEMERSKLEHELAIRELQMNHEFKQKEFELKIREQDAKHKAMLEQIEIKNKAAKETAKIKGEQAKKQAKAPKPKAK